MTGDSPLRSLDDLAAQVPDSAKLAVPRDITGPAMAATRARDPRVRVLGILRGNSFTDGGVELFDLAAQGRLDAFFLGGGQIDGRGNLNLVGTGVYSQNEVRWPGSFGSAFLYATVPRVILFREEHSRRVAGPPGRLYQRRWGTLRATNRLGIVRL